ncbi:Protein of unknown function, partial [Gryllus bimaculatus]
GSGAAAAAGAAPARAGGCGGGGGGGGWERRWGREAAVVGGSRSVVARAGAGSSVLNAGGCGRVESGVPGVGYVSGFWWLPAFSWDRAVRSARGGIETHHFARQPRYV